MPQIYANNDGYAIHYGSSWTDARKGTPANSAGSSSVNWAMRVTAGAGRGSGLWSVSRSFFSFDIPGSIYHKPESAKLRIKGHTTTSGDVIAVASDYSGAVSTDDFDNITDADTAFGLTDGSGTGTFVGQVPTYSLATSSWSTDWNTITLNDTALMDISKAGSEEGVFRVCLMNYTYDYLDDSLPAGLGGATNIKACGARYSSSAGTSSDPYLDYTIGREAIFMGANF